jgi:hypothetical protein
MTKFPSNWQGGTVLFPASSSLPIGFAKTGESASHGFDGAPSAVYVRRAGRGLYPLLGAGVSRANRGVGFCAK